MVRQDHAGLAFVTPVPQEVTLRHFELWRESVAEDRPVVELELQQSVRSTPLRTGSNIDALHTDSSTSTTGTNPSADRAVGNTGDRRASPNISNGDLSIHDDQDSLDCTAATYTLTVIGRERKGVLAEITEFLTAVGLETLSARIFTLPNHSIMDMFTLRDPHSILTDDNVTSHVYNTLFHMIGLPASHTSVPGQRSDRPVVSTSAATASAAAAAVAAAAALKGDDISHPNVVACDETAANANITANSLTIAFANGGQDGSQVDKNAILAMACMKPVGSNIIPRNLRRCDSNIAVTDLDNAMKSQHQMQNQAVQNHKDKMMHSFSASESDAGPARSKCKCQPDVDLSPLQEGDWLLYYSANSKQRYRYQFKLSDDCKFLCWEGKSLRLSSCVGVLFGSKSKTFQELHDKNDLIDPPWLCFSLVTFPTADKYTEPSTVDLACETEDQLPMWLFGLQSLCNTADPSGNDLVTYESLLVQRAKYKIATRAHDRGLTVYQYVLKKVRKYAQRIGRESEMNLRDEELAQLEAKLMRLKQALRSANARETMLATQLRTVQADWDIKYSELALDHTIGRGAYSEMWRGTWRSCAVAVKLLKTPEGTRPLGSGLSNSASNEGVGQDGADTNDKRFLHDFLEEVVVLSKLRHPNILLFMAACAHPPNLCIVTEFCHGGNLYSALRRRSWRDRLGFSDFISMAKDAARGMHYLHSARVIHRDFKSQNLLLDRPVENGCPILKVADFGLSRGFHGIGAAGTSSRDESVAGIMTSETGTYRWMAPEMIRHEPYNEKVDVYSYGVTLWEFYTCEIPFSGLSPIQAAFAVADKDLRPSPVSTYGKANPIPTAWAVLLERCWSASPHDRPRFVEILRVLDEMEIHGPDIIPPFWSSWDARRYLVARPQFSGRTEGPDRGGLKSRTVARNPVPPIAATATATAAAMCHSKSPNAGQEARAMEKVVNGRAHTLHNIPATGMGHSGSAPNLGRLNVSN